MGTYKDLDIWKLSIEIVIGVYSLTKTFPTEEKYGICSQIRRSVVSIPSNIAEGAGRRNKKENLYFINIALGSLSELDTQLIIVEKLNYCKSSKELEKLNHLKAKLLNYKKYVQKI